jgi:hypothetical protein
MAVDPVETKHLAILQRDEERARRQQVGEYWLEFLERRRIDAEIGHHLRMHVDGVHGREVIARGRSAETKIWHVT